MTPSDCHRKPGIFEQVKSFFGAPLYDCPRKTWSGSATGRMWQWTTCVKSLHAMHTARLAKWRKKRIRFFAFFAIFPNSVSTVHDFWPFSPAQCTVFATFWLVQDIMFARNRRMVDCLKFAAHIFLVLYTQYPTCTALFVSPLERTNRNWFAPIVMCSAVICACISGGTPDMHCMACLMCVHAFPSLSHNVPWKHRSRSRYIFGGVKDFCPIFPKLARKIIGPLFVRTFSHADLIWEWPSKKFSCDSANVVHHFFQIK